MKDEYIRKQDAVDMCGGYGDLAYMMSTIKPADVVPVVRCGRCRYCTNSWHSSIYDLCKITGRNVIDTDFCNYGKRREE